MGPTGQLQVWEEECLPAASLGVWERGWESGNQEHRGRCGKPRLSGTGGQSRQGQGPGDKKVRVRGQGEWEEHLHLMRSQLRLTVMERRWGSAVPDTQHPWPSEI
jgi:hypothetical protein